MSFTPRSDLAHPDKSRDGPLRLSFTPSEHVDQGISLRKTDAKPGNQCPDDFELVRCYKRDDEADNAGERRADDGGNHPVALASRKSPEQQPLAQEQ